MKTFIGQFFIVMLNFEKKKKNNNIEQIRNHTK